MSQATLLPSPQSPGVTPESLSDCILRRLTETCGAQLPCQGSAEILNGFTGRFTAEEVMAISEQAFGVHNGMWRGAPVTILRFQESHDGFFARPLLEEARSRP
jgi:hypothetical protein